MKRLLALCVSPLLPYLRAFAQYEGRGRMSDVEGSIALDDLMIIFAVFILVVAGIFYLYMKFSDHSSDENKRQKESNGRTKKGTSPQVSYYGDALSANQLAIPFSILNSTHKCVDIGLSVRWATCNIGAISPSDFGIFFAWGETQPKPSYTFDNCTTNGKKIGEIAGISMYDAATTRWGGGWRLPTASEVDELINKCKHEWASQGGHTSLKFTGPNGNSVFMPASGYYDENSLYFSGVEGGYWTATYDERDDECAYMFGFSGDCLERIWDYRYKGFCIRPVMDF